MNSLGYLITFHLCSLITCTFFVFNFVRLRKHGFALNELKIFIFGFTVFGAMTVFTLTLIVRTVLQRFL